jgi:hypothetical protein
MDQEPSVQFTESEIVFVILNMAITNLKFAAEKDMEHFLAFRYIY